MNLLQILSKYKAEDLEEEKKKGKDVSANLSPREAWELEKLEEKPRDFFTFHKEMSSQSIRTDES